MDAITKETGIVTLSCHHSFHFRCIDSWFSKQVWDDLAQTCPCCRSEGSHLDRCEVVEVEEEEEEEDEDYEEAESQSIDSEFPDDLAEVDLRWERMGPGRWMIISAPEMALECVRNLFGPLNDLDYDAAAPPDLIPSHSVVGVIENHYDNTVQQMMGRVAGISAISRERAAQKIQAFFRGQQVRNTHKAAVGLMRLFQQAYGI